MALRNSSRSWNAFASVFENLDELKLISPYLNDMDQDDLIHELVVPMHPGTQKYLTEIGWEK